MNLGFEDETREFKKSTAELKEAAISVAAILNKHRKGEIFIGVRNDGEVTGQQVGAETARDISHKIQEIVKPTPMLSVEQLKDGTSNYFRVSFSGKEVPYAADGKYYIRVSDEDKMLTQEQLKNLILDVHDYSDWEDAVTNFTAKDIDEKQLRDRYNDGLKTGRFTEPYTNKENVLKTLNLLKDGYLTNAGVVLFGDKKTITLKVAVFATSERLTLIDHDHITGNIYDCIQEAMLFVKKNMHWRAKLNGNAAREDVPEVPIDAVREIVVNSFAHAKYAGALSSHEIDIDPTVIEIFNPGRLAESVDPEAFARGGEKSQLRNKTISNVLFRTNMVEAFGTGFRRAIRLCKDNGVEYRYHNGSQGFSFEFLRKENIKPTVASNKVDEYLQLNKNEFAVYNLIKENSQIITDEIAAKLKLTVRTIARITNSLKENGYITRIGSDKAGRWIVLK